MFKDFKVISLLQNLNFLLEDLKILIVLLSRKITVKFIRVAFHKKLKFKMNLGNYLKTNL